MWGKDIYPLLALEAGRLYLCNLLFERLRSHIDWCRACAPSSSIVRESVEESPSTEGGGLKIFYFLSLR